jgi:hypothetical protein
VSAIFIVCPMPLFLFDGDAIKNQITCQISYYVGCFCSELGKNTLHNNLFEKLFDIRIFYVLSPALTQNLSSPALFSHCPTLTGYCVVQHSFMIIFFSFMMSTNAVTGVPSKVLGDLSKNTVEDNGIRLATSRAVDTMLDPTRLEGKVTRSKIVTQKK